MLLDKLPCSLGPKRLLHGSTVYTIKNRITQPTRCKKKQLHDFTQQVDRLKQRLDHREVSTMPYFFKWYDICYL
jgi:hypothetical protein